MNNVMTSNVTAEGLDNALLYVLGQHVGKKNAVDRWALVEILFGEHVPAHLRNDGNLQDRDIRYAVSRLRAKGYLICDLGDGHGRYLAATAEEFWELYNYYKKPVMARAVVLRAMKKSALHQFPNVMQMNMFGDDDLEDVYEVPTLQTR